jgi:undecaprenyl-diphosphatase
MAFQKTRRFGTAMLLGIIVGALFTNVWLKVAIARPRPYSDETSILHQIWVTMGQHMESDKSFPSGHTTAAAAAATGLWLTRGKKYLAVSIPYVALMAASRNYFIVHYPTDVIAGAIVGTLGGIIAYFITRGIYHALKKRENSKFCHFVLNFDVIGIRKNKSNDA